ncbi:MAG: GNAT family N-acetyltransferase [Candidatus Dormibacteria bacterium]
MNELPRDRDSLLQDGSLIRIRSIEPADADRHRRFIARMSDESKRLRFFDVRPALTEAETTYFTNVDNVKRIGLVALRHDDIVGIGRFDVIEQGSAEVAFAVADAVQGLGVGSLLLDRLVVEAQRRGITSFTAHTLSENERMLEVFHNSGLSVVTNMEGGECHVLLDLENLEHWKTAAAARDDTSGLRSLTKILEPHHIAVIGVGRASNSLGRVVAENILGSGYVGKLTPVNSAATVTVGGISSVSSVLDMASPPDVAVIVVPADHVLDVIDECGECGVAGCVIITAGFAETGAEGKVLEEKIVHHARSAGMRIIGPNCIGIVTSSLGMNATFMPGNIPAGNIGFASQSGAMGIALLARAREVGIGIATFVSLGNASDISSHDVIRYWGEDSATHVGLLYLESLGNPRTFVRVARNVSRQKPIVALKSGRSRIGQAAAQSHTASQATPDTAVQAVFDRAGIIRVTTLEELLETVAVCSACQLPHGHRIGIVSNAGGAAILAADACVEAGLDVAPCPQEMQEFLHAMGCAGVGNPIDLGAGAVPETYSTAVRELCRAHLVDSLMIIVAPLPEVPVPDVVRAVTDPEVNPESIPLVVVTLGSASEMEMAASHGTPLIAYPENAAYALGRLASYAQWHRSAREEPRETLPRVEFEQGHSIVASFVRDHNGEWLDPARCQALLDAYGIPTIPARTVSPTVRAAVDAAHELGYPVALKATGPTILHKTERHAVALGVESATQVERTLRDFHRALSTDMTEVVVQQMVTEPVIEVIVGGINDPSFGPLIMCGTGGILSDVVHDTRFAVAPLTRQQAEELLSLTGLLSLLAGNRGAPPYNTEALVDVLIRVGHLLADRPEIRELDCNPVLVGHERAHVVDVRMRITETSFPLEGFRLLD